eukprot:127738_1
MQPLSRNVTNDTDIQMLLPSLFEFEMDRTDQKQEPEEKQPQSGLEEVDKYQIEMSEMHDLKILAGETMNMLYPQLVGQNNIYSFTHIHENKITKQIGRTNLRVKLIAEKDKISMQIEFGNEGWDKVNKTWILGQRTKLLQDMLYDIFQLSKARTTSLNQKERGILLCEILGMDTDYIGKYQFKVANSKLKDIIAGLRKIAKPHIINILTEHIDKQYSIGSIYKPYSNLSYEAFFKLETHSKNQEFINSVWYYLCNMFKKFKNLKKMEKEVQRLCLFWKYQPQKLKQWSAVKKSIETLEAEYTDPMDMKSNSYQTKEQSVWIEGVLFQTYITTMMVSVKKAFISKTREIVIETEYGDVQWIGVGITDNQVGEFGGSVINSIIRQLRCRNVLQETRNMNMPFVKYLMSTDINDPKIPKQIKYKNNGGLRFLSPMFYPVSREIMEHALRDINKARYIGQHFDLKSLVENVMNTPKYLQTFYMLYSTVDSNGCINKIYQKYSRGIISKLASAILTDQQYSVESVKFRTHLLVFDIEKQRRTTNNP